MVSRILLVPLMLVLCSAIFAEDVYRLDGRNTEIGFTGSKKDVKHEGGFTELKGTITVNGEDVTSAQFKVEIDMNSLFSDNPALTSHLKSADFFNVRRYPKATFVSSKVEKKGKQHEVHGKLTMNGTTKELVIPATLDISGPGLSMESSFEINRHDWKISYKPKDIDEKVKLTLKVTAAR